MSTPEPPPDHSWVTTETVTTPGPGADWSGVILGLALVLLVIVLVRSTR